MKVKTLSQFINEKKKPNFDLGEIVSFESAFTADKYKITPTTELEVVDKGPGQFGLRIVGVKSTKVRTIYLSSGEMTAHGGYLV